MIQYDCSSCGNMIPAPVSAKARRAGRLKCRQICVVQLMLQTPVVENCCGHLMGDQV
jgi:hypothetical protein